MSGIAAPSSRKNSNGILSGAQEKVENHRGATVLKYDHHSNGSAYSGADILDDAATIVTRNFVGDQ